YPHADASVGRRPEASPCRRVSRVCGRAQVDPVTAIAAIAATGRRVVVPDRRRSGGVLELDAAGSPEGDSHGTGAGVVWGAEELAGLADSADGSGAALMNDDEKNADDQARRVRTGDSRVLQSSASSTEVARATMDVDEATAAAFAMTHRLLDTNKASLVACLDQ